MNWVRSMFSSDKDISSKRVIVFLATLTIITVTFLNVFLSLAVTDFIFSGLVTIVCVGLGTVLGENVISQIGKNKNESSKT